METFNAISLIIAGLVMLLVLFAAFRYQGGEPAKAILVYLTVFLVALIFLAWIIGALTLIGFGIYGLL